MVTIWFELFSIIFFCSWIFFFAEAFVQFMFVSNGIGQTRSDPWFSFISSFWIFDIFISSMLIYNLITILRILARASFGLEVRQKPSQLTFTRSALNVFIPLDDFPEKSIGLIKQWINWSKIIQLRCPEIILFRSLL